MKIGNPENYYVRALFSGWDYEPEDAHLHEGCWSVDLNHGPSLEFVDRLDHLGPPWLESSLPAETDGGLDDPDMVRLLTLLSATYAVTPNDELAGQVGRFALPWPTEGRDTGTVFYVSRAEFAVLLDDVKALADTPAGRVHSTVRRDDVIDHPCIQFVQNRLLTSPWLSPMDRNWAGLRTSAT